MHDSSHNPRHGQPIAAKAPGSSADSCGVDQAERRSDSAQVLRLFSSLRGFTLVELMVVVAIIGMLSALAIPNIAKHMHDRRVQEASQRVALFYEEARLRAMARGAAELVRFTTGAGNGRYDLWEAQHGGTGTLCPGTPVPSCTSTDWKNAANKQYRSITSLDLATRGEYEGVASKMYTKNGTEVAELDVCFTPMGRAFSTTDLSLPFSALTAINRAEVYRTDGTTKFGLVRNVLVLPNGIARLQ